MAKCPICGRTKSLKQDVIDHVEKDHRSDIPEGMSTAQFIYSLNHGRDYGLCRVCGSRTDWNEKTGKPKQLCNNPACKAKRRQIAQRNMINVYGKDNLLNDPIHQEKMLANRKISGIYTWSDNKHKFTYTGSYEKFALEWLDKVFDYDPDCIVMPGPVLYYEYNGETKPWITDMYLPELNLVIEFKDGSFDKNTHTGFAENRKKEAAKDEHMRKQNEYNYTKITNKNMMSLIKVINVIRLNNIFSEEKNISKTEPAVIIHENANELDFMKRMTNDEISSICESISKCNESAMSVANLSPIITTAKFEELKESPLGQSTSLKNSTMQYGDGENSAICDSNSPFNFMTVNESLVKRLSKIKESEEPNNESSDQIYSNHEKGTWNPFDSTDNFREIQETGKSPSQEDDEVNPNIKTDVETDPLSYGDNDLANIASGIYSSNFSSGE